MEYFTGLKTVEQIKKLYRKLAMENHPDRGGDNEIMKVINGCYHLALKMLDGQESKSEDGRRTWTYTYCQEKEQEIIDKIEELIAAGLSDGSEILLIGFWVWITGTDKKLDYDKLMEAGCKWHSKRRCWYWRQEKSKRGYRSHGSLNELAYKYGVDRFATKQEPKEDRIAIGA